MDKKKKHNFVLPPHGGIIDTHCHLDMDYYEKDRDAVLDQARKNNVTTIITIGTDVNSSQKAVALANQHPDIYACVGIHPHDAKEADTHSLKIIAELAENNPRVVGYGEIGLDYAKEFSPIAIQKNAFRKQLHLAVKLKLPIVIHDREAHADILDMLHEFSEFPKSGVIHCFSGDMDYAKEILDMGWYVSIPGIVTFSKADMLQQVAKEIDLDRLLVETDGPFLAPAPFRGKRNTPDKVLYTAQKIAELRGLPFDEICAITSKNAKDLFGLRQFDTSLTKDL